MNDQTKSYSYDYNLYKSIYENSLNAIVLLDDKGNYITINDRYTEITGYERTEVINKPIGSITYKDDVQIIQNAFKSAIAGEIDTFESEFRIVHKNSEIRWVKLNGVKYHINNNKYFILVEFFDITSQKEMSNALKNSEDKYKALFDANHDSIVITGFDENGRPEKFLDCNETAARMAGMSKEELLSSPPFEFDKIAKEDIEVVRERQKTIMEKGIAYFETKVLHADGHSIDVEVISKLFDYNGQIALMNITRDISERKKTEAALKESEEKYRTLFEESLAAVVVADDNGNYIFANKAATDIFGYSLNELQQMNVKDLKVPDDYDTEFYYKKYLDDRSEKGTFAFFTKNNEFKIAKFNAVKVKKDFNLSILMDYTETYLATKALKESEEKYRNLYESNHDSIAIFSFDENGNPSNFIDCNQSAYQIIGLTKEELLTKTPTDIEIIEKPSIMEARAEEIRTNGKAHFETKLRHKDGHIVDVEIIASMINYKGKPAVMNISRDITDRKRTELAIIENEKKYRTLFDTMSQGVILYDKNGFILSANPAAEEIIGVKASQMEGLNINEKYWDTIREDGSEFKIEDYPITRAIKSGEKVQNSIMGVVNRKENKYRWILLNATPVYLDNSDAPYMIYATFSDITDRIELNKKLQKSEAFLKTAINSIANPLYVINADDYSIAMANERGGGKDAICKKCFEVSHNAQNVCSGTDHPCTLETVKRTKKPFLVEHLHYNDKGEPQNVEIHAYPIFDENGEVKQIIEYSLNITKRKNIELELKEQHKLFDKFFHLSNEGFFFMMLDEPIEWNDGIDKEKALDYVFTHQRITKINDAMLEQYRAKREEFIGLTPNDLFAHDIKYGREVWRKFFDEGKLHIDTKEKRFDGSDLVIIGDYTCIYDEEGRIRGHFGVQSDITEQERFKQALIESEGKFRSIIENSPYSILITNQDGIIIDCNHTFEKITNIDRNEILNKHIVDYHKKLFKSDERNKTDFEKIKSSIQGLYSNPDVLPLTYVTSIWINSREVFLEQIVFRIKTADGFLLISMAQDITERKQLEEIRDMRLRLMEYSNKNPLDKLLEKTLDEIEYLTGSTIGFYHFVSKDQNTITLQAWSSSTSKEFCNIEGMHGYHYDVEEAGIWADCVRTKKPIIHNDYETEASKKGLPDGHAEIVRELVVPVLRNEKVVAILGVGNKPTNYDEHDLETVSFIADVIWEITERKRTEDALKESHERFDLAVSGSNNGIFDWNIVTNELYYSPVWKEQLGYKKDELENFLDTFVNLLHPDDKPHVMNYVDKYLTGEIRNYDNEFRMRHKNGTYKWIRAIGSALRDENDKPYRMLGSHVDITEKKERELLISNQNKELEKINAEKDKFFSIIAHDLRSPLGGIMQLSEFLSEEFDEFPDEEKLNMVKAIHKSAGNVFKLLVNLLDWSRLQRGMIPFEPTEYNLYNLISEGIIDQYDMAIKKEIILKIKIDDELKVYCDKNMIMTTFRNLVSNAIKFTNNGGKIIVDAEQNSEFTKISVEDNGIGMSDKIKDNLFNIEVNTSRKGTGGESSSGLGLILCHEFISKHSGEIIVESEKEKGSKFTVILPNQKQD
jgi:PAS domain S-box-containing protein